MTPTLVRHLAALLLAWLAMSGVVRAAADPISEVAIKAAFLYNFAKFTEWPALAPDAPITLCVVGDGRLAAALIDTVRHQRIGEHAIAAKSIASDSPLRACDVLFIATAEMRRAMVIVDTLKTLPILTVSDDKDFARSGGIVEFVVESGRMRFSINTDAAGRSGLRLSSRLLGLAKIVRDDHAQ
jgi:hypothetical protein